MEIRRKDSEVWKRTYKRAAKVVKSGQRSQDTGQWVKETSLFEQLGFKWLYIILKIYGITFDTLFKCSCRVCFIIIFIHDELTSNQFLQAVGLQMISEKNKYIKPHKKAVGVGWAKGD